MSKLALKKLLIGIIATIITLTSGITLAAALYNTREKNAPHAADAGREYSFSNIFPHYFEQPYKVDDKGNIFGQDSSEGTDYFHFATERYDNNSSFYIYDYEDLHIFKEIVAGQTRLYRYLNAHGYAPDWNLVPFGRNFDNKTVYLANDIDLKDVDNWGPIGYYRTAGQGEFNSFNGTFEGNYHTISNVNITTNNGSSYVDSYATVGFFGYIIGAEINNLRLSNININVSGSYDGTFGWYEVVNVGCLVGKVGEENGATSSIKNCVIVNGTIINEAKTTEYYGLPNTTGGLVGSASADVGLEIGLTIENCSVDCDIDTSNAETSMPDSIRDVRFNGGDGDLRNFTFTAGIVGFFLPGGLYGCKVAISRSYYQGKINGPANGITADIAGYDSIYDESAIYKFNNCVAKYLKSSTGATVDNYPTEWKGVAQQGNSRLPDNYDQLSTYEKSGNFYSLSEQIIYNLTDFNKIQIPNNINENAFYLPRTNEFNNGAIMPIGYFYNNNKTMSGGIKFVNLKVECNSGGSIDASYESEGYIGDGLGNTIFYHEMSANKIFYALPYEASGTDYRENFNNIDFNPEGDIFELYGYNIKITPNGGYLIKDVYLALENGGKIGTAENPYKLVVEFDVAENTPRNIKIYFGGFLIYKYGKYLPILRNNDDLEHVSLLTGYNQYYPGDYESFFIEDAVRVSLEFFESQSRYRLLVEYANGLGSVYFSITCPSDMGFESDIAFSSYQQDNIALYDDTYIWPRDKNGDKLYTGESVTKGQLNLVTDSTPVNSGKNEIIYLWGLLKFEKYNIQLQSTGTNQLNRQVGSITRTDFTNSYFNKNDELPNNCQSFSFTSLSQSNFNNVKFASSWGTLDITGNITGFGNEHDPFIYGWKRTLVDNVVTSESILDIYGEKFLQYVDYLPHSTETEQFIDCVNAVGKYYNIEKGRGYISFRNFNEFDSNTSTLTIKLSPINYTFYAYYLTDLTTRISCAYNVEQPFNVPSGETWGLLLDENIWEDLQIKISLPEDVFGTTTQRYTLTQTASPDFSITIDVEKGIHREIKIGDNTYSYATIATPIVQTRDIYSLGNIGNSAIPTFLVFPNDSEIATLNLMNIKYCYKDKDGEEKEVSATYINQPHYQWTNSLMADIPYNFINHYNYDNVLYSFNVLAKEKLKIGGIYNKESDSSLVKNFSFFDDCYNEIVISPYVFLNNMFELLDEVVPAAENNYYIKLKINGEEFNNAGFYDSEYLTYGLVGGQTYDVSIVIELKLKEYQISSSYYEEAGGQLHLYVDYGTILNAQFWTLSPPIDKDGTFSFSALTQSTCEVQSLTEDCYAIIITAPDIIKIFDEETQKKFNYQINFVPNFTSAWNKIDTFGTDKTHIYVIPAHGYSIEEYPTAINDSNKFVVKLNLNEYDIPLYYQNQDGSYSALISQFNVETGLDLSALIEQNADKFIFSAEDKVWGLTSDVESLINAGFTGILKDGVITSLAGLSSSDIDAIFADAIQNESGIVTLHRSIPNSRIALDDDCFYFKIDDNIDDSGELVPVETTTLEDGRVINYYQMISVQTGSFGLINKNVSANPYLKLVYTSYELTLEIGKFSLWDNPLFYEADIISQKQYQQSISPLPPVGDDLKYTLDENGWLIADEGSRIILKISKLTKDKTLSFNFLTGELSIADIKLLVFAPFDNEDGYLLIDNSSEFNKMYSYSFVIKPLGSENNKFNNDLSSAFAITQSLSIYLELTPKLYEQTLNTNENGWVGTQQCKIDENEMQNEISYTVLAGSHFAISYLEEENSYTINFTAPSCLKNLIDILNLQTSFIVKIIPKLVNPTQLADCYIFPDHGYKLHVEQLGEEGTPVSLHGEYILLQTINSDNEFIINYDLIEYNIPVYYKSIEDEQAQFYLYQQVEYNVLEDCNLPAANTFIDPEFLNNKFSWVLSSNVQSLIDAGFTHILNDGVITPLTELSSLDDIFAAALSESGNKEITLYKQIYPKLVDVDDADFNYDYDYEKITFVLNENETPIVEENATYYYLSLIKQGSHLGILANEEFPVDSQDKPYIMLVYEAFDFIIYTQQFEHNSLDANVTIRLKNQLYETANSVWYGYNGNDVIYSSNSALIGQTMLFDGTNLLLQGLGGFKFLVAIPLDVNLGGVAVDSSDNSYIYTHSFNLLKLYYSQIKFIINENDVQPLVEEFNLDELETAKGLSFQYTIAGATTLRVVLVAREFGQTFNVGAHEEDRYNIGMGGSVSNFENTSNKLMLDAFAGTSVSIAKNDEVYTLNLTIPSHLQELDSALKVSKNYLMQIVPNLSSLQTYNVNYYFYPNHGYKLFLLEAENATPLKHKKTLETNYLDFDTNSALKIDGSYEFLVTFVKVDYQIPVYYVLDNDNKFSNSLITYNIGNGVDFSTYKIENLEMDGWIISTKRQDLLNQGFTHVYVDSTDTENDFDISTGLYKLDGDNIDATVLNWLFSKGTITLYKDNSFTNEYDFDKFCFVLGEGKRTADGFYYIVQQLSNDSYGSLANDVEFEECGPYIRSFKAKTYTLNIDNLAKDSETNKETTIHAKDLKTISNYFGVNAKGTDITIKNYYYELPFGNGYSLQMTIKNTENYNYPFFSNNQGDYHTAFYQNSNYTQNYALTTSMNTDGNYWYVFNYGYEVKAWKIIYEFNNVFNDLSYENYEWSSKEHVLGGTEILIEQLNLTNFADVARYLDNEYIHTSKAITIYMIPVWQPVKIMPIYNAKNLSTSQFDFGGNYNLSNYESRLTPEGQSLIYFKTNGKQTKVIYNPIVRNGSAENVAWNYRNISYEDYEYRDGVYRIALTPEYVDNIYKVDFNVDEIKPYVENDTQKYVLISNDYVFANNSYTYEEYVFSDTSLYANANFSYTSYTTFKYSSSNNYYWNDDYANILSNFKNDFESSLLGGNGECLPILRKIYYTGNVELGNCLYNEIEYKALTSKPKTLYIYLANNQNTGFLPAFLTNNYELTLWYNQGVNNNGKPINYAYKTDLYLDAEHLQDTQNNDLVVYQIWKHSQCYIKNKYTPMLNPHYYRKYYYLNPQTILDENNLKGDYGYLTIKAETDEPELNANYLVIYLENDMHFYTFSKEWGSIMDHVDVNALPQTAGLINDLAETDKIKIYANSNLTFNIFDQSQDEAAMSSGLFDCMIGYQWKSLTWWDKNSYSLFDADSSSGYSFEISNEEIDKFHLTNASVCNLDIVYSKIQYYYDIAILDKISGSFSYINNENESTIGVEKLTNLPIKLGENNIIIYSATLGYEFAENAFVLVNPQFDGAEVILATYTDLIADGNIVQSITINLSGKWLRENFYNVNYVEGNYGVENCHLGEVEINTTKKTFSLYAKIYDSSKNDNIWLEDILLNDSWIINNSVSLENIFVELPEIGNSIYGYKFDNKLYAVVSTFSYISQNPTNHKNLLERFDFLLTSRPTNEYDITSYLMENLGVYPGIISNKNEVYIVVEVSPLLYVDVVVKMAQFDTNSTSRQITIQNQNTTKLNDLTINLSANNETYTNSYGEKMFKIDGATRLYTYFNQMNYIPTDKISFSAARYSGLNFAINGITLKNNQFSIRENSILEITFVPKLLALNISYQLEGNPTTREQLENDLLLQNLTIQAEQELFVNSNVEISFEIHPDYLISITRNGLECTIENNSVSFSVSDSDYDFGAVNVVINIYKKPNRNIIVRLRLQNNNQQTVNDNLGTLTLIVGDEIIENASDVNVVENKKVEARLSLNRGYVYAGEVNILGVRKKMEMDANNVLTLIEAFRVETRGDNYFFPDAGEYIIYVRKEMISLQLINNQNEGTYTIYNNSVGAKTQTTGKIVQISNAYVGSEISFGKVQEVENFELDYFYYLDKSNQKIKIESNSLILTSNLLTDCAAENNNLIQFGIATRKKYKIELNITASVDGLENYLRYTTNLADFTSGKYYSENTAVEFKFFGSILNKYDVTLTIDGETITKDSLGYTCYNFTLLDDVTIQVFIEQSKFNIDVKEYHYNTLADLENPDLSAVESEQCLNNIQSSSRYSNQETISIAVEKDNYLLTSVEIKIGENVLSIQYAQGELQITFNGQSIHADENGDINLLTEDFNYKFNVQIYNNSLLISYRTEQDLSININYINVKEISPQQ